MPKLDVDAAYDIDGPESARDLYSSWASTYDSSFGDGWGYVAPREIARIFTEENDDNTPILDVGAGTGLIAENLQGEVIDAIDITRQMLDQAQAKGLYRNLITGDVLKPLEMASGTYGGVISSGTFTHGHVGPACLPELLRVCRPGALFVCGCIPAVFDNMGFGSTLAILNARGAISSLSFKDIPIYENVDHTHAKDRGLVMIFRKA